jgi:hypothetical protein
MKKILLAFTFTSLLLIATLILSFQPIMANDPIDGTFNSTGFNNPTEYTKFQIQEVNSSGDLIETALTSGSAFTPQMTYRFTLGVSDEDTLEDIESIQVHFYFDEFVATATTNNDSTYVVLEWSFTNQNFVLVTNSSFTTSWNVERSSTPTLGDKSGDFTFDLKMSMVARFSNTAEWRVGLVVVDGLEASGYEPKAVEHPTIGISADNPLTVGASGFDMQFFGLIKIPAGTTAIWNSVRPNMEFGAEGSKFSLENINYIANGQYNREIKASPIWEIEGSMAADGSTSAALTIDLNKVGESSQSSDAQLFAIKALDSDTVASGVIVPGGTNTEAFNTDITFTNEEGVDVTVYLWLAISSRFQNATYKGQIILSINNSNSSSE